MNKTQFLCATGALSTLFCAEAQAYVDPGSGAAIITAVLGAIGAIGYTFRKYYYKIKNGFQKRNGNKPRLWLSMSGIVNADFGSFRDPVGRVYTTSDGRILRGLDKEATAHCNLLLQQSFFQKWAADGKVVETAVATDADLSAFVLADGWAAVFEHTAIDFISYPYEWTFSMLKDAALLQLELLETSMKNGWTIKDATPYNIQWRGANPIFIDIPSFVPMKKPEPWLAYRQFCMLFLYPLMLKAHLDIDFNRFLRADLDGLAPTEAALFFSRLAAVLVGSHCARAFSRNG